MAGGQSSSHHEERRHRSDRERERSGSSHHTRTISSTTLLLVLSLILAVLAVMLSLPSSGNSAATGTEPATGGFNLFGPKRSGALISREGAVAQREAEVARREAEILAGAPGGVIPPNGALACPPCLAPTIIETVMPPAQTVIKEIVKEDGLTPPGWHADRFEGMIERELKIAERERDISKREEQVNRREHDASRRESWIMEQLMVLGNEGPQAVEEEYVYEPVGKRKAKVQHFQELPPLVVSEYAYGTVQTKTIIQAQTVPAPAPANTRLAPFPTPEAATSVKTDSAPRTTAVEIIRDEGPRTILRPPVRPQKRGIPIPAGIW